MGKALFRFNKKYLSSSDIARVIADDVNSFFSMNNVENSLVEQFELCLVEVVNNAYEHAYKYVDGLPIEILCLIGSQDIKISISDFGDSMSEKEFICHKQAAMIAPDPENPETWMTSGRGISIVVGMMEQFNFEKKGIKNTFIFQKRI